MWQKKITRQPKHPTHNISRLPTIWAAKKTHIASCQLLRIENKRSVDEAKWSACIGIITIPLLPFSNEWFYHSGFFSSVVFSFVSFSVVLWLRSMLYYLTLKHFFKALLVCLFATSPISYANEVSVLASSESYFSHFQRCLIPFWLNKPQFE